MYGNYFYVKCYAKYPFIYTTNSLYKAEKYAKRVISKGYYKKSEIYLVNGLYKFGDYFIKGYTIKNNRIERI